MNGRNRWFAIVVLAAVMSVALTYGIGAGAQDAGPPGSEPAEVMEQTLSLGDILKISGWPMYLLVLISFAAAALVIYFFFVLRTDQVSPLDLRQELASLVATVVV